MNIDTDMQWAFWDGVHTYYKEKKDYLQGQIGNPEGDDKPNKKFYDPRAWLRSGEQYFISRLQEAFDDLNALNRNITMKIVSCFLDNHNDSFLLGNNNSVITIGIEMLITAWKMVKAIDQIQLTPIHPEVME